MVKAAKGTVTKKKPATKAAVPEVAAATADTEAGAGVCFGCSGALGAEQLQCPLCQAQEKEHEGLFCGQECFAKNWAQHRADFHQSGIVKMKEVRAKRSRAEAEAAAEAEAEAAAAQEAQDALKFATYPVWPVLKGAAKITPDLPKAWKTVTVRVPAAAVVAGDATKAVAATVSNQLVLACVNIVASLDAKETCAVVANDPHTAAALRWALQSNGIACRLMLCATQNPEKKPRVADKVVVTTVATVKSVGSDLVAGRALVSLPGTTEHIEAWQAMTARAVYFTTDTEAEAKHSLTIPSKGAADWSLMLPTDLEKYLFDDDLIAAACTHAMDKFFLRVAYLCTTKPKRVAECVYTALAMDWGGADHVAHHHKLAFALRGLLDLTGKFEKKVKESLATAFGAAIAKLVSRLEPIARKGPSDTPNLTLQATLTYVFASMPAPDVDTLAVSWGVAAKLFPDAMALSTPGFDKILRVYTAKSNGKQGKLMVAVMFFILRVAANMSVSLNELQFLTQWDVLMAAQFGPLAKLLTTYGFKSTTLIKLTPAEWEKLPKQTPKELPLVGTTARKNERFTALALEEVLSAMPPQPKPMYIGDVGNLIGAWTQYRSKYDNALPTSLQRFMEEHPEAFTVMGTLVTRVKAGTSAAVKIRHTDEGSDTNSDFGDGGKKGKQGRRAKQIQRKKDGNKKQFDKNRKSFDPSAMVPGYTKPRERAVKGRGNKKNIRRFKQR